MPASHARAAGASQDEILLLSTKGKVLAINKAAERRLATRMGGADPIGARLDRLLPLDQAEERMAIVRQVADTATLVHCDTPIRSRWFEFWFYPVIEPDRPVSGVAVFAREISQQKKSQADLSKLFQAIQQRRRRSSSPTGTAKSNTSIPSSPTSRVILWRKLLVAVKMLERLGLQPLQAETAKDALELLAGAHADVLFTDIELPGGMNGTEVAHGLYPEFKVLFTTGYAREATLHERGLHEYAPWLLKPYSHQDLGRELRALLARTVH